MNDQQRDSLLFDVTIEGDAAKALLHSLSPDPENGECTAIRLQAGNGHEGYGIYVSDDEYPEEGSMFLAALTQPQPQAQQAAAVPAGLITKEKIDRAISALDVNDGGYQVVAVWLKSLLAAAPPAPVLPLSDGKWEVRVAGPDDVHTLETEIDALRQANEVNKAFVAYCLKNPDDHVLCVATVHGITAHGAGGESTT